MRYTRWGVFAALLAGAAVVAALVGTTGGNAAPTKEDEGRHRLGVRLVRPDGPFDNPALAAAKIESAQINGLKKGRSPSRSRPATRRATTPTAPSRARSTCSAPARTSSSRPATSTSRRPSSRRRSSAASSRSRPASAPTRWGRSGSATEGKLAFSFGNVAQDEGSAMAPVAWSQRLEDGRTRDRTRDRLLQERRDGVREALQAARRQDRRRSESYAARRQQRRERREPP